MRAALRAMVAAMIFVPVVARGAQLCADISSAECRRHFAASNIPRLRAAPRDSAEYREIVASLVAAIDAEGRAKILVDEIARLEAGMASQGPADSSGVIDEILRLKKSLQSEIDSKYRLRNHAIQQTIGLYGLSPGVREAPRHSPAMPGAISVVSWSPRYGENQVRDQRGRGRLLTENEKIDLARKAGYPQGKTLDYDGATSRASGAITLFPRAFASPEDLAGAILHETIHWLDMAAAGRKLTPYESFDSERRAYGAVIDNASALGLAPDKVDGMRRLQARYAEQAALAGALTWGQVNELHPEWLHVESVDVPEREYQGRPEAVRERGELEFLDSWRAGGGAVAEKLAAGQAVLDRERRERERRERDRAWLLAEIAKLQADQERRFPPSRRSQFYVIALAGEACADPSRIPPLAEGGMIIRVALDRAAASFEPSDRLNECQRWVLARFDNARRTGWNATSGDFMRWAKSYRDANPSLLQRLASGFTGFFEVFEGLFRGGSGAPPSSAGGGGISSGSRDASQPSGGGCEYTYIPELGQTVRSCPVN